MADYATTYTKRYRVHYFAAGYNHTVQLRGDRSVGFGTFMTEASLLVGSIFSAVAGILADDFEFISAEYAAEDSPVFIPLDPPTAVTGTKAIALYRPVNKIMSTTFSGKTTNGTKARISLFGLWWDLATSGDAEDFVVTALEDTGVEDIVGLLNGASEITAIDSVSASWYRRATIKPNDAWIRRVRAGV